VKTRSVHENQNCGSWQPSWFCGIFEGYFF
jgi:hypothetical protein